MKKRQASAMEMPVPTSVLRLLRTLLLALCVLALYFGRDILMPLALAALLAFLLAPMASWFRRWRMPHALAVTTTMLVASGVVLSVGLLIGSQVGTVVKDLPSYQRVLETKLQNLRQNINSNGSFRSLGRMVHSVEKEVSATTQAVGAANGKSPQPVSVAVLAESSNLAGLAARAEPFVTPLIQTGITLILAVFILLEWADLRDRLLRLGGINLLRMTDALEDASQRLRSYFAAQLGLNVGYGLVFGLLMYMLGVPGALAWGLLAGLLRFIPYAGPVVAGALPMLMALVSDPGWSMLFYTALVVLVMELITNNIIEPVLYGNRSGLGTIAILISATFWTALWGPVGLILATPISVCLAALGRHVPRLAFFDILLGSGPALPASSRLYQRLLAQDWAQAESLSEEAIATTGLPHYLDEVAVPALQQSMHSSDLAVNPALNERIAQGLLHIVSTLPKPHTEAETQAIKVLAVGMHGPADQALSKWLAYSLSQDKGQACLPAQAVAAQELRLLPAEALREVSAFVICQMDAPPPAQLALRLRHLTRLNSQARILVLQPQAQGTQRPPLQEPTHWPSHAERISGRHDTYQSLLADLRPQQAPSAIRTKVTYPEVSAPDVGHVLHTRPQLIANISPS